MTVTNAQVFQRGWARQYRIAPAEGSTFLAKGPEALPSSTHSVSSHGGFQQSPRERWPGHLSRHDRVVTATSGSRAQRATWPETWASSCGKQWQLVSVGSTSCRQSLAPWAAYTSHPTLYSGGFICSEAVLVRWGFQHAPTPHTQQDDPGGRMRSRLGCHLPTIPLSRLQHRCLSSVVFPCLSEKGTWAGVVLRRS